jgi:hypothetical protein
MNLLADKKYVRWGIALLIGVISGLQYLEIIPTGVAVTLIGLLTGGGLAYKADQGNNPPAK